MRRLVLAVVAVLALPAAARAETVTDSYRVPTVDGAQVYAGAGPRPPTPTAWRARRSSPSARSAPRPSG